MVAWRLFVVVGLFAWWFFQPARVSIELHASTTSVFPGEHVVFDKVLLIVDGESVKIGTPYVEGAKVEAIVLKQGKGEKKIVFKYHSKARYRKKKGHRQLFTEVEIR